MSKAINTCLEKYFYDLDITRVEVVNLLKNLLFDCTVCELRKLHESHEIPSCLRLMIDALFFDIEADRCDTMISILDSVFH